MRLALTALQCRERSDTRHEPALLRVRRPVANRLWLPSVACSSLLGASVAGGAPQRRGAGGKARMARIDRVQFLGTGSAVPVPGQRNMSSVAIMLNTGAAILVDCGEGTQHQIKVSTMLKLSRVEAILLTHLHGDHCYGIFGLLQSAAIEGRKDPMLLMGPQGLRDMVMTILSASGGWFAEETFPIECHEIPSTGAGGEDLVGPGSGPRRMGFHPERCKRAEAHLLEAAGLKIQAVPLVHGMPDWGYVLTEQDRPGKLDAVKARELGVPANSPLLGQLKQGKKVTLPDGSEVLPCQVLGPPIPGRTIAVLQDTSDASSAIEACQHAACVVHEATFEASMEKEAVAKGHSTSAMAAHFAAACGAKRLVLSHFSARYARSSDVDSQVDPAEKLGEEAREILGDVPVTVAQDCPPRRSRL
ncbi:unnamed protein product [Effrenium voratum]|nr:unnamed protein product [Effrenium voratum]